MMHPASDITQWTPRQLKESMMMRPLIQLMTTIMIMTMVITKKVTAEPTSSPWLTSSSPSPGKQSIRYLMYRADEFNVN